MQEISVNSKQTSQLSPTSLQLSLIAVAPEQCPNVDVPLIPATFRGDGYRIPPRRADSANAPLSFADCVSCPLASSELAVHDHYKHYMNDDKGIRDLTKSPRVERLQESNSNGTAPEFPVLLGNSNYTRIVDSSASNEEFTSTHTAPISPMNYRHHNFDAGLLGTPSLVALNGEHGPYVQPSSGKPFCAPSFLSQTSYPAYTAWGSLPLVSHSPGPTTSKKPSSFLLPPSPYVTDSGNTSLRSNGATSSLHDRPLFTPPTVAHEQILPPNIQPLNCKVGYSVPGLQCPILSGHQHNRREIISLQHPQQFKWAIPNGYMCTSDAKGMKNPNHYPYIPASQPMPTFGVYVDYADTEGRWIHPADSRRQTYPFNAASCELDQHTLFQIAQTCPSSLNGVASAFHDGEGKPLWNPPTSGQPHTSSLYSSTQQLIPQNFIQVPHSFEQIESRVAPESTSRQTRSNDINGAQLQQPQQGCRSRLSIRHTSTNWGVVVPSQQKKNSKKWWTFCSGV